MIHLSMEAMCFPSYFSHFQRRTHVNQQQIKLALQRQTSLLVRMKAVSEDLQDTIRKAAAEVESFQQALERENESVENVEPTVADWDFSKLDSEQLRGMFANCKLRDISDWIQ